MKIILLILLGLVVVSCAQITTLTGGKRDTYAPRINAEKSLPKQGQLNYTNPKMTLVFDEYIVLKDPINNISITPQPNIKPTVTSKNKKLTLVFNEPLLENTTYSVSFNGAIADLNEGNDSLFQYVFSTGSFIDSLVFTGTVNDAFTNKGLPDVIVGLYPISDTSRLDSIPHLRKPTYVSQTDKDGRFKLNYIKTGNYQAFAYTDIDKNLLFNPATENLAFLDSTDCCFASLSDSNTFRLFKPVQTKTGLKSSSLEYPGKLTLIYYEDQPEPITLNNENLLLPEFTGAADSLVYWLTAPFKSGDSYIVAQSGNFDTIRPFMKNLPKKGELAPLKATNNLIENKILPNDTLSFTFNEPFKIINKEGIVFYDADSNKIAYQSNRKNVRTLQLIPESDSAKYLKIDSAAIRATLNNATNNVISLQYEKHPDKFFGLLNLTLQADSLSNYILELLTAKGVLVTSRTNMPVGVPVVFQNLKPGQYQLRLVNDKNGDGAWTTGSLTEKRQPENVYYYETPVKIRSNWDMDIEWILAPESP